MNTKQDAKSLTPSSRKSTQKEREILEQHNTIQAICLSCRPTNSIKTLMMTWH